MLHREKPPIALLQCAFQDVGRVGRDQGLPRQMEQAWTVALTLEVAEEEEGGSEEARHRAEGSRFRGAG